jgi:group I intron endonuclease
MGFIYKIVNKTDGKIYVGQTTKTLLEDRFKEHRKIKGNCRYLLNALKKYGVEGFEYIVIEDCLDSDLNELEIMYISSNNSLVPNGYNLKSGGNSGGKHHEETKKKISESLKGRTDIKRGCWVGRHHTEETKKKISESMKGRTDIFLSDRTGKRHTEKSKEKMRSSNKTQIPVNQYDLEGNFIKQFASISDASRQTNIVRASIGKCCNNVRQTAGGSIWQHSTSETLITESSYNRVFSVS